MGKSSSSDPRSRILDAVGDGRSRRLVAAQLAAAPSTAIRLVRHFKRTGNREPVKQGRPCGYGKLAPHLDFLIAQGEEQPDATLPELAAILKEGRGIVIHPGHLSPGHLSKVSCKAGFTCKETLLAAQQERADVRAARVAWQCHRQPALRRQPGRLAFIDETAVKTSMCRLRGRAPRGERLKGKGPLGKVEHSHLHRRPALPRPDSPVGERRCNEPGGFRSPCRNPARCDPE